MESKLDYKDRAVSSVEFPREVYYRCIWTVRDTARMIRLTTSLDAEPGVDSDDLRIVNAEVIDQASRDLECINAALAAVPEVYRTGIMDNIVSRKPFDDLAHPNTWKKWKQIFLHELAKRMHLI